uniref:DRTGG domain-containing protein n=1 Tax=Dictyoglomus turgidum TaxID=513050 RepID=A0A7C3SMC2_9BACT
MKAKEIVELINGKVLAGENLLDEVDIKKAFAADLMSDVLAMVTSNERDVVLITGITNSQIVRTAEILDIPMIIICRGKVVPKEVIELSKEKGIILVSTDKIVFEVSGILYNKGIKPASINVTL